MVIISFSWGSRFRYQKDFVFPTRIYEKGIFIPTSSSGDDGDFVAYDDIKQVYETKSFWAVEQHYIIHTKENKIIYAPKGFAELEKQIERIKKEINERM